MNISNNFQDYMKSKGYNDINMFFKGDRRYTSNEILQCAMSAVKIYERGEGVVYKDNIETYV